MSESPVKLTPEERASRVKLHWFHHNPPVLVTMTPDWLRNGEEISQALREAAAERKSTVTYKVILEDENGRLVNAEQVMPGLDPWPTIVLWRGRCFRWSSTFQRPNEPMGCVYRETTVYHITGLEGRQATEEPTHEQAPGADGSPAVPA